MMLPNPNILLKFQYKNLVITYPLNHKIKLHLLNILIIKVIVQLNHYLHLLLDYMDKKI
jgi:hypothetical protein